MLQESSKNFKHQKFCQALEIFLQHNMEKPVKQRQNSYKNPLIIHYSSWTPIKKFLKLLLCLLQQERWLLQMVKGSKRCSYFIIQTWTDFSYCCWMVASAILATLQFTTSLVTTGDQTGQPSQSIGSNGDSSTLLWVYN